MADPNKVERIATRVTRSIGSPASIAIHTFVFFGAFALHPLFDWSFDTILLFLTTVVSLEAIYLAIFIQMTINHNTARLTEVSEDVEEIQEDVGEIQENVEELSEGVEDITEEMEEDEREADKKRLENRKAIENVESVLLKLLQDLEGMKNENIKNPTAEK